jgi:hypothetical protein
MNANQNPIRQNRPSRFFAAGAALLVSTLVLSSVIGLFASVTGPAAATSTVTAQYQAASPRV